MSGEGHCHLCNLTRSKQDRVRSIWSAPGDVVKGQVGPVLQAREHKLEGVRKASNVHAGRQLLEQPRSPVFGTDMGHCLIAHAVVGRR